MENSDEDKLKTENQELAEAVSELRQALKPFVERCHSAEEQFKTQLDDQSQVFCDYAWLRKAKELLEKK